MGCYGVTVITAVTSQNTVGVQGVMPVPGDVVRSQLHSIFDDIHVDAIKIGMIPNAEVAKVVTEELKEWASNIESYDCNIVLDPVMVSTSGTRLMAEECIDYIRKELFPLCTLVTPNIPEAEILPPPYPTAFLIKGGHTEGKVLTDTLCFPNGNIKKYTSKRIETTNLHGTGCTLSSAIAAALANGESLLDAVAIGKDIINKGLIGGHNLRIGKGNGPLWIF